MNSNTDIVEGVKVHYTSPHGSKQNGIVKRFNDSGDLAWVVYNCNEEWSNYKNYTGAATRIEDLTIGWYNQGRDERVK